MAKSSVRKTSAKLKKRAAPMKKPTPKASRKAAPRNHQEVTAVKAGRPSRAEAEATPVVQGVVQMDVQKKKNPAGLSTKELGHYRELLLAKRRELLGDVRSMETEALQNGPGAGNLSNLPDHMADQGTDNYEQEFTLGLMEKDRQLLREIDAALGKIAGGSYGVCEGTGLPITKARLEAQPWARYSIEHARKLENGVYRP